MKGLERVRVVKRGQTEQSQPARAEEDGGGRETKDVVSGWVREHVRRSEEFRSNYARLLRDSGFVFPRSCGKESA